MVRHLRLDRGEEIAQIVAQRFHLPKFSEIGFAAFEKVPVLLEELRYVVLQVVDFEVARFSVRFARTLHVFRGGIFFLNQR